MKALLPGAKELMHTGVKMARLLGGRICRMRTLWPHDECPMAVALKQNGQVTGLESRGMARRHSRALHGLPDTVTRRFRSTRGSGQQQSLYRSLLR
jgi:hypothetical protein